MVNSDAMFSWRTLTSLDGRWAAAAIVALFFLTLGITAKITHLQIFDLGPYSWVGPMPPYFADLRGVVAGTERMREGIPAWTADLHDPWNRPYNYPKWPLYSDLLGLNRHTVIPFGLGLTALFFASSFYALGRLSLFGGLAAGIFLVSVSIQYAVVRGNLDIFNFILIALALAWRKLPALAGIVIAIAASLKLYPLFGFLALLSPPWKKSLIALALGLGVFGLVELGDLQQVMEANQHSWNLKSSELSFGSAILGIHLIDQYNRPELFFTALATGSMAYLLLVGITAPLRPTLDLAKIDSRQLFAFRLGAGIFLGSFGLGINHDYRCIFLLFCLPLLLQWIAERTALFWSRVTLWLILGYVNWNAFSNEGWLWSYIGKQAVAWGIATGLIGLTIATLPEALQWPKLARQSARNES